MLGFKFLLTFLGLIVRVYTNKSTTSAPETVDTLCVRPYIVKIEAADQESKQTEAFKSCFIKLEQADENSNNASSSDNALTCSLMWDSVTCWPETSVNTTARMPCPDYINKFNTKSKR